MIKKEELLDAIAECQGERNPNANTCIKLAAYYTILNNVEKQKNPPAPEMYSYDPGPTDKVMYNSGSEFSDVIKGMYIDDLLEIIDELMDTMQVIAPKLYRATINKIKS